MNDTAATPNIPRFDLLVQNYPANRSAETVKKEIGGHVDQPMISDTCAVRMSRTLNYSGVPVPHNVQGLRTVSGQDHLWYAFAMQELKKWLYQRFGQPQITAVKPHIRREQFAGHKGIIAFDITFGLNVDPNTGQTLTTRALGHLDLWDGDRYTHEVEDTRDYFQLATKVVLWEAP
jgi:type VI secretion system (T6SS) effector Tae4 (amidase)